MRVLWIVVALLLVIGLGALSTTCTGPRPRPTGETIPPDEVLTTIAPGGPAPGG